MGVDHSGGAAAPPNSDRNRAAHAIDRDTNRVPMADRVELVTFAATETSSIHRGTDIRIQHSGNGYRVQVPVTGTGLQAGDGLPCHAAPGLLVMAPLDGGAGMRHVLEMRRTQALEAGQNAAN